MTGLGLDEDPDGTGGALAKRPCLSLGSEMLQSVMSRSRPESALGLSRNKDGYRYCRVKGGEG